MSMYDLLQRQEEEDSGQVKGVALGIVTNNRDEMGLGRIKVRFPWRENDQESYWARLAVLMAGDNRGTVFIPEIGDEVLVAFDRDDIRHPYILGALWNGKDSPPEKNADGQNNIRKIRSRSGHEIIFNDDKGTKKEKLEIHTNAGHTILLDDSAGKEKIEIRDHRGTNLIVIDSVKQSMTIESGLSLTIKSKKIDIEAAASMTLKATGTLTIQGAFVRIN